VAACTLGSLPNYSKGSVVTVTLNSGNHRADCEANKQAAELGWMFPASLSIGPRESGTFAGSIWQAHDVTFRCRFSPALGHFRRELFVQTHQPVIWTSGIMACWWGPGGLGDCEDLVTATTGGSITRRYEWLGVELTLTRLGWDANSNVCWGVNVTPF